MKKKMDITEEVIEKILKLISTEAKEMSLSEYKEFLEQLTEELQIRIDVVKIDLEYKEE